MRGAIPIMLVGLLALAPTGLAAVQPGVYYLQDSEAGATAPGEATSVPPSENASSSQRLIAYSSADSPSALFDLPAHSLKELRGTAIGGAWIGDAARIDANLSATLYAVAANGSRQALAHASHSLLLNPDDVPSPTQALPPNGSAEAAAMALAGFVANATKEPPVLFQFGYVQHQLGANETLALGLYMEPGSGGLPLGAATLKYGSQEAPSFILVPWYAPDPVVEEEEVVEETATETEDVAEETATDDASQESDTQSETESGTDADSDAEEAGGNEPGDEAKDTPFAGGLALLALAAIGLLLRRR